MDAWSAIIIMAGPVSALAMLRMWTSRPGDDHAGERETLSRELCGSLAAMNTELDRLALEAGRSRIEGKRAIYEEIGRIEKMKEEMLCLGEKLRYPGPEKWGETRDETVAALEKAGRRLGGVSPDGAQRHREGGRIW